MNYINISNNEILTLGQVKSLHPTSSFPKVLTEAMCVSLGIAPILPSPKPQPASALQQVILDGAVLTDEDIWVQSWIEVDKFSEPDKADKAAKEAKYLSALLTSERERIQKAHKASCQQVIYEEYPAPIQSSASLDVYPSAVKEAMVERIALIIAEENRVYDLLDKATTLNELYDVEEPVWPTS